MLKFHRLGCRQHVFRSFFLMAIMMSITALSGSFNLRVDDVSGRTEPWPVVGGLPFADGELRDADSIRITSDGKEIPAQIDVAATWRDGSIRWALASFNAEPKTNYACEYGTDTKRSTPKTALTVTSKDDGAVTVDTGAAVYEFTPDKLLPERARMGTTTFLERAGDGACLVDNQGRTARVAGPKAEVSSEIVKNGPTRTVIRRDGWYVTENGDRLARARAWFYFFAGKPFMKVTHSLILTENTNKLWIRDYGLTFRTGAAPKQVVFALGGGKPENLLATKPLNVEELVTIEPEGGEAYMLQDVYPQFLDRDARAVIGKVSAKRLQSGKSEKDNFWTTDWVAESTAAGDWGDGEYDGFGLTLVMPWLAQQFPAEIDFGPESAAVAFWSGRCGRELDFRTVTLVNEYWRSWSEKATMTVEELSEKPSNAQCAAPTRDVWLLPRTKAFDEKTVKARGIAAARPPLLQADPAYLTATEAMGWPSYPVDTKNFPREEEVVSDFWNGLIDKYEALRRTGFMDFGCNPFLRGATSRMFRISSGSDYGLRQHVWNLYGRGGDRRHVEFGKRCDRFFGDWHIANWTAGGKIAGGNTASDDIGLPLYWGDRTEIPMQGPTGHDVRNWLLDYYFTGDEYALNVAKLHGEAFRKHWDPEGIANSDMIIYGMLSVASGLHSMDWDEDFERMARELAEHVIDPKIPVGLTDERRNGAMYKVERNILMLYLYYMATGDEKAKKAILQAVDYKYRFNCFRQSAFSGQAYPTLIFAIAYRWTGNPNYLRLINYMMEQHRQGPKRPPNVHRQMNPFLGMPAGLAILARVEGEIDPFPVIDCFKEPEPTRILFRKPDVANPVTFGAAVIMENHKLEPNVLVTPWKTDGEAESLGDVEINREQGFRDNNASVSDLKKWHVDVTVPSNAPAGIYHLEIPHAHRVTVLDSTAPQVSAHAPKGFKMIGNDVPYYFIVEKGTEKLKVFLDCPMEIRRPDGSVALEAKDENIGKQEISIDGHHGAWSVVAKQLSVFTLRNAPPLFSRCPKWLLTNSGIQPIPQFEPPSGKTRFLKWNDAEALYLPGKATLRFPRGAKTSDGYENFPTKEGTIEFWFRPNWSSAELLYTMGHYNVHTFIEGGSCDLQYSRGQRRPTTAPLASMNLWLWSRHKKNWKDFASSAGFTGPLWFEAGEWYHVAAEWKLIENGGKASGEFDVFINGKRLKQDTKRRTKLWGAPRTLSGDKPFPLLEANEWIKVGPLDGTIAQLRISDVVRYKDDFTPSKTIEPDDHTTALFPLAGTYEGVGGSGSDITLKK